MNTLNSAIALATNLIEGHHRFLNTNTGDTNDSTVDHYVFNSEGVMSNNRHFLGATMMETLPNGDGTTESQSLIIIGYAWLYLATKNPAYLAAAEKYFDAYITYFYDGQPIPTTPQRYISNWIVNSKEPVLANYPLNATEPTHSGFKGVEFTFTNGLMQIPHGSPNWGEYLDVATYAYVGSLAWDAINASVQAYKADGVTVDWNTDGTTYPVNWIIGWDGNKVDYNGNIISSNNDPSTFGTVQLQDTTVTGTYKFNYAVRLPVEYGGTLIGRNQPDHNRPCHVPLVGDVNLLGNSADSEQWFADASYLLWKITGDVKYQNAMNASLFTIMEYTNIDRYDMFFRQSTKDQTPWTDGISYDFQYPNTDVATYSRDSNGYIDIAMSAAGQEAIEQQAIWFRVDQTAVVRTTYGGVDTSNGPLQARIQLALSPNKGEGVTGTLYGTNLPSSTSATPQTYDIPIGSLALLSKPDGSDYLMADTRAVTNYGNCTYEPVYETGILGNRSTTVVEATFPTDSDGLVIGFWLETPTTQPLTSLTYKCDADMDLKITDDNNWNWYWVLPNNNMTWTTTTLDPANLILSSYQPNAGGRANPTSAVFTVLSQFDITPDSSSAVNTHFSYYCVNDIPPTYTATDGYTLKYRLTVSGANPFTMVVGDCTILNFRNDSLAYTPGVIPFSNIYSPGTQEIGAWHGMPYPGYQYPWIYTHDPVTYSTQLNNMVNFLYDSQQWYNTQYGQLGPGAAAYIWNRWDNYKYGTADTFTNYNWGTDDAWAGYQPRAFQGSARAWYEMMNNGNAANVPVKMQQYVENWINWLVTYVKQYNAFPTEFPAASVPTYVANDFTGHMTGLWLAGCCFAALAGSTIKDLDWLIEKAVAELAENYVVTGVPGHKMDGSWSPAVRLGTDNGMYYGFWAGEIFRGLGLYILYKKLPVGGNVYQ